MTLLTNLPDWAVRWLRFILPALGGTILGVFLEANVWHGRGQGAPV
jgi:hypothetical protein